MKIKLQCWDGTSSNISPPKKKLTWKSQNTPMVKELPLPSFLLPSFAGSIFVFEGGRWLIHVDTSPGSTTPQKKTNIFSENSSFGRFNQDLSLKNDPFSGAHPLIFFWWGTFAKENAERALHRDLALSLRCLARFFHRYPVVPRVNG